jgi:hypothetical protein
MPPITALPAHLSIISFYKLRCNQHSLWSRNITDSAGLSSQAKIGLISAGAVVFVLLVLVLTWYLRRRKIIHQRIRYFLVEHYFQNGTHGNKPNPPDIEGGMFLLQMMMSFFALVTVVRLAALAWGCRFGRECGIYEISPVLWVLLLNTILILFMILISFYLVLVTNLSQILPLSANPCDIWGPSPYEQELAAYIHNGDKGKGLYT